MAAKGSAEFPVLKPNLQISFYYRLQELRELYLHEALKKTIEKVETDVVDRELSRHVKAKHLKRAASFGLRGELFFPVPCLIEANPFLLGYYRLLFGLSQKEFYNKGPFGRFKRLEDRGEIPPSLSSQVPTLCSSLCRTSEGLVAGIDDLSLAILHDLQLLTLGPQLRGSENTRLGQSAAKEVFEIIHKLVKPYVKETTPRTVLLENDSHRAVMIEFFSDPDVRVTEKLPSGVRPLVSMEIKGGRDSSNIHNRLGEAEKSHQKAKNRGFFEFWTIVRVDVDPEVASRESPTTSRFFHIDRIRNPRTKEHREFRELLSSMIGVRIPR